ncbi:recombinase family protein [Pararhizobium sp. DWP3-4]|uniref:recombinase family protein n=1 Tax=Pararhizobium sp. DWP3-4 TaxID=2804565 RepID=UPI003CF68819
MSKPRAYSYIRMSTDIQLKGDSLRRQTEASEAYATENGLELVRDFKLQDLGVSAFKGLNVSQGALGQFLTAVESQLIPKGSYLLVESLDRLSRERPQTATALFLQILEAGVHIVTLTDGRVYRSGSDDLSDIIISVVIMSRAFEESQTKSIRVSAAWSNKRKNASSFKLTKVAPAWLELSADRTSFQLLDDRVAVIREIFQEAERGRGSYQIARMFNLASKPTFIVSDGWYESYITKILTNRAVLGEFQPHHYVNGKRIPDGDPVTGYFPAIIEHDLFDRVQVGRKNRLLKGAGRKGRSFTNLFQGIAKCGYCGGNIMVVDKGPKPKGGVYLRCDNARRGHGCTAGLWQLDHFEKAFLFFVKELNVEDVRNEQATSDKQRSLEEKGLALTGSMDRLSSQRDRAFDMLANSSTSVDYISERMDGLTRQIDEVKLQIATNQQAITDVRGASKLDKADVLDLMANLATDDHATLANLRIQIANWIRNFIDSILVYPEGREGPPANVPQSPSPEDEVATFAFDSIMRFAKRHDAVKEDLDRHFFVGFKSGMFRSVSVDRQDASKTYHFDRF